MMLATFLLVSLMAMLCVLGIVECAYLIATLLMAVLAGRVERKAWPRAEVVTVERFHWDGSHHEYKTTKRKGGWV
jgi:hypothetical protein